MERKIGEIFDYGDHKLKVVESNGYCHGLRNRELECFFNHGLSCTNRNVNCCGQCGSRSRSDNTCVCFAEVTNKEKNMEEKLDLIKILKIGDKVYSPIIGECIVRSLGENTSGYTVYVENPDNNQSTTFNSEGKYFDFSPETTLFPSRDHRVWDDEAIMIIRPPKKGDYLISGMGNPFIYDGEGRYGRIVARDNHGNLLFGIDADCKYFTTKARYATPEEIKEFDEFLKSKGYYFDKEKLELKKLKWRAAIKETYYYMESSGIINYTTEDNVMTDGNRFNFGNYFRTKEEAEAAKKQIKELLNNYHNGNN